MIYQKSLQNKNYFIDKTLKTCLQKNTVDTKLDNKSKNFIKKQLNK